MRVLAPRSRSAGRGSKPPPAAHSLTRPDAKAEPAPDLVGRDFHAERPGTKLVDDITCLPTAEGWLYLACWSDLATREVVGYAMADHHRAELVVDALDMAHGRGGLESGCVVHSDRGSEYTSTRFRDQIRVSGLRQLRTHRIMLRQRRRGELLGPPQGGDRHPHRARPGHRPRRGLLLHRDLLQSPPPAQAQDLRLSHPGRGQAAAHPCGMTITCPRSRGNLTAPCTPEGDQSPEHVQPVVLDEVEEPWRLLGGPGHDRRGLLAGLLPARDALVAPDESLRLRTQDGRCTSGEECSAAFARTG